MEKKRNGPKTLKFIALIMLLAVITHTGYSIYNRNSPSFQVGLSGNIITEDLDKVAEVNLKTEDKIILISEWLLVISLIAISVIKERIEIGVADQITITSKKTHLGISKTDLDLMYELINEKKEIKVMALVKYFGVDSSTILEWGRVLEEANLIKVRYPTIGDPILSINKEVLHVEK